jgi:hypothetical protein
MGTVCEENPLVLLLGFPDDDSPLAYLTIQALREGWVTETKEPNTLIHANKPTFRKQTLFFAYNLKFTLLSFPEFRMVSTLSANNIVSVT